MPPRRPNARWPSALLLLAAAALVGWLGREHGLRFVDIVSFSRRARELSAGRPASDGLYPLGYPAMLAIGHAFGAPVLLTARALSLVAAVLLVGLAGRRLGFAAAIWILAQPVLLTWGATEGTDLLAASLSIGAVLLADRPVLAGICLGLAIDVRWTSAAWIPALWIVTAPRERLVAISAMTVGTLPHWMACAWSGHLVFPDQGMNLAMAAGPGAPPQAAGTWAALTRIPSGLLRTTPIVLPDLATRASAALLPLAAVFAAGRGDAEGARDRRLALALFVGGVLHTLALAAVFANPRLAVPATLAALFGVAVAIRRLGRFGTSLRTLASGGLLGAAAAVFWFGLPGLRAPTPDERMAGELASAFAEAKSPLPPGQVLANNPVAYTEADGWLVPSVNLGGLYVTPRTTPEELARLADEHGLGVLVLDATRSERDYAGLHALFAAKEPEVGGWTRVSASIWRVWVRPTAASAPR